MSFASKKEIEIEYEREVAVRKKFEIEYTKCTALTSARRQVSVIC